MIYEKIVNDIETDIHEGMYHSDKKLPSVRTLSKKYNCNTNTVIKAYEILKNKHIIYSIPQSGYYVIEQLIKHENTDHSVINFSTGNPIMGDMHTPDFKHCLDRAVDLYKNHSMSPGLYGIESLRRLLPKYLADFQVFTAAENIFINLGIQHALSILAQTPFPNGKDVILVEQPTYKYCIDFLKFLGANVIGIKRDENGIDLHQLEALFKKEKIKFFYTIPRNHNPLGTSYHKTQRKAIAELAAKYDVYIVEDDYFGDITFDSKSDPIYAYGDHYHHIYLKNFSKLIPWFRVGIIVVPTHFLPIFKQHIQFSYYSSYFTASLVSQATLEIYIRSNLLKKHTASVKKELAERLNCLQTHLHVMEQYDIKSIGGNSGFYSYLKLPDYINENQFIDKLRKQNVWVAPGKPLYWDDCFYEKGIRLSVARTNTNDINRGFHVIYEELERQAKNI